MKKDKQKDKKIDEIEPDKKEDTTQEIIVLRKLKMLNQNIDRLLTIFNQNISSSKIIVFLQDIYSLKEIVNTLIDRLDDYLSDNDKLKELEDLLEDIETSFIELLIKIDTSLL